MSISENFDFVSALIGGVLIGIATSLLLFLNGKIAGISGITKNILSNLHYKEKVWRTLFVIGLMAGGLFIQKIYPENIYKSYSPNFILSILGGLLVGIGTSLGNGCTSGHGICGITRRSKRSIIATITFMSFGILTVYFMNLLGKLV
ncbi:MAG: YeeE/YedE family protein [Halobacteriovoraceae bacterium]|nr:YeeE/YedE family protein [Halobacteriovoraceae bacterium]